MLESLFFCVFLVMAIGLSWFFANLVTNKLFDAETCDKKQNDPFDKFD